MNKENEKICVELNEKEVQEIIDCYEKDIKYIKQLEDTIDKAIEYIKENADDNCSLNFAEELLDILKGSNKDIPGFEGTLEELDNLSIRGK